MKKMMLSVLRRLDEWTRITLNPVPVRHDR